MKRMLMALVALALLGAACGGGGGGETTDTVTMVDNAFEPSQFTAASDTVTVSNEGSALHSFTIPDAGVDIDVQPGDTTEVDVGGVSSGEHPLECKYHPEMTGTVTVQ